MNKNFLKRRIDELEESGTGGGTSYPNETTLLKFSEDTGELLWGDKEITSTLHTHTNKTLLDNLGEDEGELTYNGVAVNTDTNTDTFEALTDTPNSYTGEAGKIVSVNSTEDGLEFITPSSGGGASTFTELTDTPSTLGTDGQFLGLESDMYGQVSMKWKDFPTIPQELTDFSEWPNQNTATEGQVLSLSANMSGGNDLVWVDAPSGGGGGATTSTGTWTPTIVTDNNGTEATGVSYVIQEGYWYRVGDLVTVYGRVRWDAGPTDEAFRIPLPVPALNDSAATVSAMPNQQFPSADFVGGSYDFATMSVMSFTDQLWFMSNEGKLLQVGSLGGIQFSATYQVEV